MVSRYLILFLSVLALGFINQAHANTGSIDSEARDSFHHANREDRENAADHSDVLVGSMLAAPYLLKYATGSDNSFIATAQAQLLTGALVTFAKETIPRRRPYQHQCENNAGYDKDCFQEDSRKSFFSGHTALSFTTAGLMCRFESQTLCYSFVGLAATAGILRMNADKHFLSDVLTGAAVGWLSGYYFSQKNIFGAAMMPSFDMHLSGARDANFEGFRGSHNYEFMLTFMRDI